MSERTYKQPRYIQSPTDWFYKDIY